MTTNNILRKVKGKEQQGNHIKKVTLDLTIDTLDLILQYICSSNTMVEFRKLRDLKKMMDMLDVDKYNDDRDIRVRIYTIMVVLDCVVTHRIDSIELISQTVKQGKYGRDAIIILSEIYDFCADNDLSNSQIEFIESFVADRLQYSFIFNHNQSLEDMLLALRMGDFESLKGFCGEFKEVIGSLYRDMSSLSLCNKHNRTDFNTSEESLDGAFSSTITELKKPSNIIKTGLKKFNEMLNGGFQSSRVYLILGETGGLISSSP